MSSARLQLALEHLGATDWGRFERLCSAFLSTEFAELRTTASMSGDGGRDSELYAPLNDPSVVMQYSVAKDWAAKILATATRLRESFPGATVLVFVSSQVVGAAADAIKRRIREDFGLALDIRDRNWFVERATGDRAREAAAEELARVVVDPLLADRGLQPRVPAELDSAESIAALTYLGLQWRDDVRDKGLTKLAFEALVRSALKDSDTDAKVGREEIRRRVRSVLQHEDQVRVDAYVDAALKRLTKKAIRHYQREDEFCLAHDERQRVVEFKTQAALAATRLQECINAVVDVLLAGVDVPSAAREALADVVQRTVDAVLLRRSQAFALSVQTGAPSAPPAEDLRAAAVAEMARVQFPNRPGIDWLSLLENGVREVVLSDEAAVREYLRTLADAYTLFAFLRLTPDVQGAVEKMFTHGQIWLDTTSVLPLFAETLNEETQERFTRMVRAAGEAGLELFVTAGVLEEVERHMNRALACVRIPAGQWRGRMPYLLDQFLSSGRTRGGFAQWLENFRGDAQPEQDIADYLFEEFGIRRRDLHAERDASDPDLRNALQQLWYEAKLRRWRDDGAPIDDLALNHLVEHDIECYCGVVRARIEEHSSPFGYSAWWLTLDRSAFDLKRDLRNLMTSAPPDSPVISADFLVNYLAFGPVRRRVSKSTEASLPLVVDAGIVRYLTPELIEEAEAVRAGMTELPERIIRRRVRDQLNRAKLRVGPVARAGMSDMADELLSTE